MLNQIGFNIGLHAFITHGTQLPPENLSKFTSVQVTELYKYFKNLLQNDLNNRSPAI